MIECFFFSTSLSLQLTLFIEAAQLGIPSLPCGPHFKFQHYTIIHYLQYGNIGKYWLMTIKLHKKIIYIKQLADIG